MYRVINKTQKELRCGSEATILSNKEIVIDNDSFDFNIFQNEDGSICQIISEYGEHSSLCYGRLQCTPEKGGDGTIFSISE